MSKYFYINNRSEKTETIRKQLELIRLNEFQGFFIDNSGGRLELLKMQAQLKEGDTLYLNSLNSLELSSSKFKALIQKFMSLSIHLISIAEGLDTEEKEYTNFFSNSLILLEWQQTIPKNSSQKSHKTPDKTNCGPIGRPRISLEQIEEIKYLRQSQQKSIRFIANECNVSIGTVYNYIKK